MALIFEILTFILTGILIYHSLKLRGKSFTGLFFITGGVLGILRENVIARLSDLYVYNPEAFFLWIGAAPAVLMVFWSFSIYISMTLSEHLAHGELTAGVRVIPTILLSMVFMGAFAAANEAMASTFPMVLWKFKPDIVLWGGTPLMTVFGYAGLAAIMLVGVYLIHQRGWKGWVKVAVGISIAPVMIAAHLGWIALVRKIIGLFVS